MATPVPVVSMMYFLVSTPPNTFTAVSPAFWAISVKFAMLGLSITFCVGVRERKGPLNRRIITAGQSSIFCTGSLLTADLQLFTRSPQARRIDPWILRSAISDDSRTQPPKETDPKDELHVKICFPL